MKKLNRWPLVFSPVRVVAYAAVALIHVSCLPLVEGEDVDLAGQQVRFTLLHTSDLHSRLLPYDFNPVKTDTDLGLIPEAGPFGGATRIAAIVKRERANAGRVLHLDSGDSFQGAPIFNLNLGEAEYKFLSLLKVDAAVVGNHEFDAGAANFTKQLRDNARFPVLAANYQWEDWRNPASNQTALYVQPYTIKNIGGVRVGIIGTGNLGSLNSIVERGNSLQIIPLEENEIVRSYVEFLRPSVDLMMVVSHAGLTEDQDLIEGYEAFFEWSIAKKYAQDPRLPAKPNTWTVLEWYGDVGDDASVVRVRIPGVEGIDAILGGHLHIVLNPPQQLTDPKGRRVILSHGGAFAKYVLRMDLVLQMPERGGDRTEGAEILSNNFDVFPIDALWCDSGMHSYYSANFWQPGQFINDPKVRPAINHCRELEDKDTTQLLLPYITDLDERLALTSIFAYAPEDIARRNSSAGGDSPLGNIAADSMRRRQGVEAEVALTNSLGIRDNLYAGPLTQEAMFNVFPFENTINIMFISGREMQELFDFSTEKSSDRGCVSQSQVSGVRFTMDCAQAQLNRVRIACDPAKNGADCPNDDRSGGRFPWQCLEDTTVGNSSGGRCWSHPATNVLINGKPVEENESYRIAVNDYIARGGSGFLVLKRNTTRVETGIPLRDSLVGYMQNFCSCTDMIVSPKRDEYQNIVGKIGQTCGERDLVTPSKWVISDRTTSFCNAAKTFQEQLLTDLGDGCSCADVFRREAKCGEGPPLEARVQACLTQLPAGPVLGRCGCRDALAGLPACGNVTRPVRNFCENPMALPIAVGLEDGRISRRVK